MKQSDRYPLARGSLPEKMKVKRVILRPVPSAETDSCVFGESYLLNIEDAVAIEFWIGTGANVVRTFGRGEVPGSL